MKSIKPATERFWKHVLKTDGCWIWTASTDRKGYGQINRGDGKPMRAHRLSWQVHFGIIPDGLFVCHHCDNPICVKPDHLFLGTNRDNMQDASAKNRTTRGMRSASAKLTNEQVIAIRAMNAHQKIIAKHFGISRSLTGLIRQRKRWAHLP